jgi:hypothetical protein
MIKFFLKIWHKIFPPNDWLLVQSYTGKWTRNGEVVDYAHYNIEWSAYREKYKLNCFGHKYTQHTMYGVVMEQFAKCNRALLEAKGKPINYDDWTDNDT